MNFAQISERLSWREKKISRVFDQMSGREGLEKEKVGVKIIYSSFGGCMRSLAILN